MATNPTNTAPYGSATPVPPQGLRGSLTPLESKVSAVIATSSFSHDHTPTDEKHKKEWDQAVADFKTLKTLLQDNQDKLNLPSPIRSMSLHAEIKMVTLLLENEEEKKFTVEEIKGFVPSTKIDELFRLFQKVSKNQGIDVVVNTFDPLLPQTFENIKGYPPFMFNPDHKGANRSLQEDVVESGGDNIREFLKKLEPQEQKDAMIRLLQTESLLISLRSQIQERLKQEKDEAQIAHLNQIHQKLESVNQKALWAISLYKDIEHEKATEYLLQDGYRLFKKRKKKDKPKEIVDFDTFKKHEESHNFKTHAAEVISLKFDNPKDYILYSLNQGIRPRKDNPTRFIFQSAQNIEKGSPLDYSFFSTKEKALLEPLVEKYKTTVLPTVKKEIDAHKGLPPLDLLTQIAEKRPNWLNDPLKSRPNKVSEVFHNVRKKLNT